MKSKLLIYIKIVIVSMLVACGNHSNKQTSDSLEKDISQPINPSGFKIDRGINISHWLSQCFGWSPRNVFITKDDIKFLDSLGFDHIRLPIDEENLWTEDGKVIDSNLTHLTNCIDWCLEYKMRVVVDLHILRSHHFNSRNNEGKMTLWNDSLAQDNFIQLWRNLSEYLSHYPDSMVAYEPMNEPVAPEHDQWNNLITRCITEIRKLEPNRVIILGSNRWQKPHTYPYLEIPKDDKNIILSFHTYHPYFVTHYKAYWSAAKDYTGPVSYPGTTITKENYEKYVDTSNEALVSRLAEEKALEHYDKAKLLEIALPAITKAKEYGLQLYCNEFGCLRNVSDKIRYQYYRDVTEMFRENNIAYAPWDYKGDFGLRHWNKTTYTNEGLDEELAKIFLKNRN